MNPDDFAKRTYAYSLQIARLIQTLNKSSANAILSTQLLRASTSVGANYRAACRARSRAEFLAKMGIVEEEADESLYWLELLRDSGAIEASTARSVAQEGKEILSMTVQSIKTARSRGTRRNAPV
jgi:four helix bundle protein